MSKRARDEKWLRRLLAREAKALDRRMWYVQRLRATPVGKTGICIAIVGTPPR